MSSPYVTQLDPKLAPKLKEKLLEQDFELSQPPHTLFSGKKKGISCTLYSSGKLVIQGKGCAEFVEFTLEPEILQTFEVLDTTPRIGSDEAGKGDFFGPLCVAGVYADEKTIPKLVAMGVRDSKAMKDDRIIALARKIVPLCPFHVLKLRPQKYNDLYSKFGNLNTMLAWCHSAVLETLHNQTGCQRAIVDKFANARVLDVAVKKKGIVLALEQKVRAESDVVVAAASILARAAFVREMERLSAEFGLEIPKGAAPKVITAGRQLVAKHGEGVLERVGKLHFKTKNEILC